MKRLLLLLFSCVLFLQPYCQAQPLTSEESPVTLSTATGDIKGRLLLPANATTCPVVLLIAGSGPTDMDGNNPMMKNNSLKFLAEGLAQKGIASLRFDKRGIAGSAAAGKEESKLRFEDYVNDVTGWIDFLAKDKRFTGITVAGHSEGSLIGMLACQSRPKVKSFISIAGAGSPAYEIIEKQVAAQMMPESIRKEVADINRSLRNGKEVAQVPAYLQALFRPSVQIQSANRHRFPENARADSSRQKRYSGKGRGCNAAEESISQSRTRSDRQNEPCAERLREHRTAATNGSVQ